MQRLGLVTSLGRPCGVKWRKPSKRLLSLLHPSNFFLLLLLPAALTFVFSLHATSFRSTPAVRRLLVSILPASGASLPQDVTMPNIPHIDRSKMLRDLQVERGRATGAAIGLSSPFFLKAATIAAKRATSSTRATPVARSEASDGQVGKDKAGTTFEVPQKDKADTAEAHSMIADAREDLYNGDSEVPRNTLNSRAATVHRMVERGLLANKSIPIAVPSRHKWRVPVNLREGGKRRKCASVEEMGEAAAGDVRRASLKIREAIKRHFAIHGASAVRLLPASVFCARRFVLGKSSHDGVGNTLYRILTAPALAMMLNRSVIVGEVRFAGRPVKLPASSAGMQPWSHLIDYSTELLTMEEVKQLWKQHDCERRRGGGGGSEGTNGTESHSLAVYELAGNEHPMKSAVCHDWMVVRAPIVHLAGGTDASTLQFALKSLHPAVRSSASSLLGRPWLPDSRGNLFGELAAALLRPSPVVLQAIKWALGRRGDVDYAVHVRYGRMVNEIGRAVPGAISECLQREIGGRRALVGMFGTQQGTHHGQQGALHGRLLGLDFTAAPTASGQEEGEGEGERVGEIRQPRPRVLVLSDHSDVINELKRQANGYAKIIHFDHEAFLSAHPNYTGLLSSFEPSAKSKKRRDKDWGTLPRWVAVVEFFLASRARNAFLSASSHRVFTTFAQLSGALAAAQNLGLNAADNGFHLISSLPANMLDRGLRKQKGESFVWHTFGGSLSCYNQTTQCARTPILPYTWWDGPWQSPIAHHMKELRSRGLDFPGNGRVTGNVMQKTCSNDKPVHEHM